MLTDGRRIPTGHVVETEICIVGGGAAGITLAMRLLNGPHSVVVLESGDVEVRDAVQALNAATGAGVPYPALDASRVRALGGTTHRWGGWCCPLDASDFERRDWVPHSGWPFPRSHLEPYYARARAMLGIPPGEADGPRHRAGALSLAAASDASFDGVAFAIAPLRFGAAYLPRLRRAAGVEVILHANALRLGTSADGSTATAAHVATLTGNRFAVRARVFVLAAGGLENPRLLLASTDGSPGGIGNAHDVVGRFFSDHLHVPIGALRPRSLTVGRDYGYRPVGQVRTRAGLALSARTRREHALLGGAVTLHDLDDPHDVPSPAAATGGYPSLMAIARAVRAGRWPDALPTHVARIARSPRETLELSLGKLRKPAPRRLSIALRAEQSANPESRVTLDDVADRFGMRRARLDWRLSEQDLDSIDRTRRLVARSLVGEWSETYPRDGTDGWPARMAPGAHHMGTTRMHRNPRAGVVDEHGRVHGTTNVYVTGSSVFPTGGWAPPTLTIVALAIRLADDLAARLR